MFKGRERRVLDARKVCRGILSFGVENEGGGAFRKRHPKLANKKKKLFEVEGRTPTTQEIKKKSGEGEQVEATTEE